MGTAGASSGRQEANVARAWRCNLSIPPLLAHRERCRWMDVLAKWDETGRALHDFLWLISGNSDCIVGPSISWEVDPNNLSPITDVSFDNASGLFTVTTLFLSTISITVLTFYYCNYLKQQFPLKMLPFSSSKEINLIKPNCDKICFNLAFQYNNN